ncbi:hypothetical protein BC936DRAFT_150011 [Jimgerdemannia flammicorona]|uniref:Uncharacterized protein n=1 Tax=Jimgerdemannia flammicorona TaxID=994334 RepID=A0A433CZP2_9FUNG|nr:hypothetical protein BC936DRAFT_150011 [Jimgerdemannia flammicorona]
MPVNQEHLITALCSFSVAMFRALSRIGIDLTEDQRRDYVALWRSHGHLGKYDPLKSLESAEGWFLSDASKGPEKSINISSITTIPTWPVRKALTRAQGPTGENANAKLPLVRWRVRRKAKTIQNLDAALDTKVGVPGKTRKAAWNQDIGNNTLDRKRRWYDETLANWQDDVSVWQQEKGKQSKKIHGIEELPTVEQVLEGETTELSNSAKRVIKAIKQIEVWQALNWHEPTAEEVAQSEQESKEAYLCNKAIWCEDKANAQHSEAIDCWRQLGAQWERRTKEISEYEGLPEEMAGVHVMTEIMTAIKQGREAVGKTTKKGEADFIKDKKMP